jgi:hypothetical protein
MDNPSTFNQATIKNTAQTTFMEKMQNRKAQPTSSSSGSSSRRSQTTKPKGRKPKQ